MNVSAVIVTRGEVDLSRVLDSMPAEWEQLVWDNGDRSCRRHHIPDWAPVGYLASPLANRISDEALASPTGCAPFAWSVSDLAVYGRYAAVEYASGDLILTQDDDCVIADPQAIVDAWLAVAANQGPAAGHDHVVCNMPPEFRAQPFYADCALVGFGAAFHRDAPRRAFKRLAEEAWDASIPVLDGEPIHLVWEFGDRVNAHPASGLDWFHRRCDIAFTALTPRVLVDVPKTDLPHASDPSRLYRQPDHLHERQLMLDLALEVRDAP